MCVSICELFWSVFGIWYLGLRHVSLSQRGSEHAAESLKRRETKAPREISPSSALLVFCICECCILEYELVPFLYFHVFVSIS